MGEFKRIVLTGGPCAGKTTALQKIEKEFTEKGYKVFIIKESATEIIESGARPFGVLSVPTYEFQREILKYQLYKEEMYERFALTFPQNTKCLFVCDRGALDNKAYIEKEQFQQILDELSICNLDLIHRYHMILHLITAANGAEQFYTLANNHARTETIEEAKRLDMKTMNCWMGHPNLKVIPNSQGFEEKMHQVIRLIHQELNMPVPIQNQRKILIDPNCVKKVLSSLNFTSKIQIEQFYVKENEECCFRKMSDETSSLYYEIHKQDTNKIGTRIKTVNRLMEKDYLRKKMETNVQSIIKDRYSFVYDNQYFRFDIFQNLDLCLLEIEGTEMNDRMTLPSVFEVLDEVTDHLDYRNFSLFQILNQRQIQKSISMI